MSKNIITQITEAADKYADNIAVTKLIEKMELAQAVVKSNTFGINTINPLYGYEKASAGDDGFNLLMNPNPEVTLPILRQINRLHELAVIVDCLVSVLTALGEEFDY